MKKAIFLYFCLGIVIALAGIIITLFIAHGLSPSFGPNFAYIVAWDIYLCVIIITCVGAILYKLGKIR